MLFLPQKLSFRCSRKSKVVADYIPTELIAEILARLPVDALLRCTSVCKSWYSLITSSDFISLHLKLSTHNQEPRLLARRAVSRFHQSRFITFCKYNILGDNQTIDKIPNNICPPSTDHTYLIGSCNGLFCLGDNISRCIILWNPSIRKEFILTYPWFPKSRDDIGFGFVPATNDYKVVIISYSLSVNDRHVSPSIVYIYELSTNSWRNVDIAAGFPYAIYEYKSAQALVNGCVHWVAHEYNNLGKGRLIVSFDLTSEKLGTLMVPSSLQNVIFGAFGCYLFSVRESLCLVYETQSSWNIWVMKEYGVTESWEMYINIPIPISIRFPRWYEPIGFQERGKLLFSDHYEGLFSYDLKTRKHDNNFIKEEGVTYCVHSYTESLVLIKHGKTSRRTIEESRPKKKISWIRWRLYLCN